MITFLKAKINKWRVEAVVYGLIASFLNNKNGRMETVVSLIDSLKGLSGDELRNEFVEKIAEIVHNDKTQGVE